MTSFFRFVNKCTLLSPWYSWNNTSITYIVLEVRIYITLSCIITTYINIFCCFLTTTVEIIIVSLIHASQDSEITIYHFASPVFCIVLNREYRQGNQQWTIRINWQHRVHKTKKNKAKTQDKTYWIPLNMGISVYHWPVELTCIVLVISVDIISTFIFILNKFYS